ncbi:MAG: cation diffusion facilitator family transporter [Actinomycetota bacterium]|nr:cation diffusion facilitator family transporter [Actinomycetota bacterium]
MGHDHGTSAAGAQRDRLLMVFLLTTTILVVEVIGGLISGSLALLADAGHMLTDAAGIGLALLAIWFGARPATPERTFGFYRVEILAAVVNAVLLFGVAGFVLIEAWRRLQEPPEVASGLMLTVALVGLAANAVSMWLLRRGQSESLNLRGAYLEVLGDLLGSAAVLVAAAVIALTDFQAADPIASAVIGLLILPRTWRLLREAVDVLLEATPKGVDLAEVRRHLLDTPGVADVHDLHAWTITSGLPVLSAHVVIQPGADAGRVLDGLGTCLAGHFDIEHSTFQLEQPEHRDHECVMHQ